MERAVQGLRCGPHLWRAVLHPVVCGYRVRRQAPPGPRTPHSPWPDGGQWRTGPRGSCSSVGSFRGGVAFLGVCRFRCRDFGVWQGVHGLASKGRRAGSADRSIMSKRNAQQPPEQGMLNSGAVPLSAHLPLPPLQCATCQRKACVSLGMAAGPEAGAVPPALQPTPGDDESIKVLVRVRPLLPREAGAPQAVYVEGGKVRRATVQNASCRFACSATPEACADCAPAVGEAASRVQGAPGI